MPITACCWPDDMPLITLALDASTYSGSVAILKDGSVVAERELPAASVPVQGTRSEGMMPAIAEAMLEAAIRPADLSRIICGEGPGSFTSLRIAASLAKGFAHALNIPLYSVSSLALVAAGAPVNARPIIAAISAMRGEYFVADFHTTCESVTETVGARILEEGAMRAYVAERNGLLFIAGTDSVSPRAGNVSRVLEHVIQGGPVDLNSWEPRYGRLAEAQVRWEKASGKPLTA